MGSVLVHVSGAVGGDARPALAAARLLRERGHRVTVLADGATAANAAAAGLEALALPDGSDWGTVRRSAAASEPTPRTPDDAESAHLGVLHDWSRSVAPVLAALARERGADVLLAGLVGLPAAAMAGPLAGARVVAVSPTYVFGPYGARAVLDDVAHPFVSTYGDYLAPLLANADLALHATTASFDPAMRLPDNARLVGPLLWDGGVPGVPEGFAADGPPWAVVVMPSVPLPGDAAIAAAAVAVLSERPARTLVVTRGRPADALGTLPPNAAAVASAPLDAVLSRAAVCVCPASNAPVMAALRHGLPLVVVPWTADQPGVAWRVSRAAVGVSVVPDGDVAGSTKDAVERVLDDGRYRENARGQAAAIAAESSPTAVADLVEPLLG